MGRKYEKTCIHCGKTYEAISCGQLLCSLRCVFARSEKGKQKPKKAGKRRFKRLGVFD
jgi:hypothetical protein